MRKILIKGRKKIEGEVAINEITAVKDSFITAQDEDSIALDIRKPSELFIIKSPKRPSYRTYADKMNNVIS